MVKWVRDLALTLGHCCGSVSTPGLGTSQVLFKKKKKKVEGTEHGTIQIKRIR